MPKKPGRGPGLNLRTSKADKAFRTGFAADWSRAAAGALSFLVIMARPVKSGAAWKAQSCFGCERRKEDMLLLAMEGRRI